MQPLKPKKIPQRRCIGCGERFDKSALIRIVRTPEGDIVLDRTGKRSGRGAYLCHRVECLRRAKKANRLAQNPRFALPQPERKQSPEAEV